MDPDFQELEGVVATDLAVQWRKFQVQWREEKCVHPCLGVVGIQVVVRSTKSFYETDLGNRRRKIGDRLFLEDVVTTSFHQLQKFQDQVPAKIRNIFVRS